MLRFCLNDKPILLNGLLDQGYWPEGLYTPPSDAAVERELSEVKALGYNLLRKHAKIEPQRWYYHCDKLGLVVWQDMVNGGSKYNLWFVTYLTNVLQPLMRRLPDKAALWGLLSRAAKAAGKNTAGSWKIRYRRCAATPAWAAGCPSMRGGGSTMPPGQCRPSARWTIPALWTRPAAGTIRAAGDVYSLHNYFYPLRVAPRSRTVALSEYGGIAWPMPGHEPPRRTYGYGTAKEPGGADRPLEKAAIGNGAPAAEKGAFGAGVHPADRCGGRGERPVYLRPHRHQAGRQRRPFGERRPCRRVCKIVIKKETTPSVTGFPPSAERDVENPGEVLDDKASSCWR